MRDSRTRLEEMATGGLNRRQVLRRAAALGIAVPLAAGGAGVAAARMPSRRTPAGQVLSLIHI